MPILSVALAGLGGFIAIAGLGLISMSSHTALLIAPFGATCVLLFTLPSSPLSQPINVIGGHVVCTLTGLTLHSFLPDQWWAVAIAVGVAIALMALLRVTHPPAGADPVVVFATSPHFFYIISPVVVGAILLVIIAIIYHRLSGVAYPLKKD